ncbi:MAG: hypothetical protein RL038_1098, partial [Actinomycetota bacterium]
MSNPTATAVNAADWPDIARVPNSPFRAWVARKLLEGIARKVDVKVTTPDGKVHGNPNSEQHLEILDNAFFHRLGADLKIGLGESYMAGDWRVAEGSDLALVLTPFAARLDQIVPQWLRTFRRVIEPRHPSDEENSKNNTRRNISRHYDLSNDLFANFLDSTMTYSAAWFELPFAEAGFEHLPNAQRKKVDGVLDFGHVVENANVLEIGTGWGQLALQASSRGANVHTVTLSSEQQALAQTRIDEAGLTARVNIELKDYRDVVGQYDSVVSVEMIEAVGEKYWPIYFGKVAECLKPGGHFGLQAITMNHQRLLESKHAYTWIHKYIFPGGIIPSVEVCEAEAKKAGMQIVDRRSLRLDYAHTLKLWRERYFANLEKIRGFGFDETFDKMWEFYLAYSEAGFRS